MIPERIVQTARTNNLSTAERASQVNVQALHPEWDYQFYDDARISSFVRSEFSEYKDVFDDFPRAIQRIDFFRYLVIYRYGGFYFDLDVYLCESLESLRSRECVFPFEELTLSRFLRKQYDLDWELGNYAFGCAAGHPFLAAVIENCVRSQTDRGWASQMMAGIPKIFRAEFEVLNSTGPGVLSRTLVERPTAANGVTVLFPGDVLERKDWHQFGRFGAHLMAGSWRSGGSYLYRRIMWLWASRVRRRMMAESERRGARRQWPVTVRGSSSTDGAPANLQRRAGGDIEVPSE